ncbi:MAG: hypothetical protein LQ338_003986 [Usnochroma carphineum]|nr:MAG: hypothetical protein LQ338_003986 [Usnochroma carphineum]
MPPKRTNSAGRRQQSPYPTGEGIKRESSEEVSARYPTDYFRNRQFGNAENSADEGQAVQTSVEAPHTPYTALHLQREELRANNDRLRDEVVEAENRMRAAQQQLAEQNEEIDGLTQEMHAMVAERDRLREQVDAGSNEYTALATELQRYKDNSQRNAGTVQRQHWQIIQKDAEIQAQGDQIEGLRRRVEEQDQQHGPDSNLRYLSGEGSLRERARITWDPIRSHEFLAADDDEVVVSLPPPGLQIPELAGTTPVPSSSSASSSRAYWRRRGRCHPIGTLAASHTKIRGI